MNKNSQEYENIMNFEKQISSMLEKVLIDEENNDDMTDTNYNSYRNEYLNQSFEQYSNFIRSNEKKPKTVSYKKNQNFNNLLSIHSLYNYSSYCPPTNKIKINHLLSLGNKNDESYYEEILEYKVRLKEYISEDVYNKLKGNFYNLLISQNGSRVIQLSLKKTDCKIILKIFYEIIQDIPFLLTNLYANYFCQKLFLILRIEERAVFLFQVKNSFYEIAVHKIGTYPLQYIIEQLVSQCEKDIILSCINDQSCLMNLSMDFFGTHVIEKIIATFEENVIDFIYVFIFRNFKSLSNHINGLCVVKKAIIHSNSRINLYTLREKIINNVIELIHNPYGNYVIQTAYECWTPEFCDPISRALYGNFFNLSILKFSSNVIEKCLEICNDEVMTKFIEEISPSCKIVELIKSSYGNYVLQKAINLSKIDLKNILLNIIKINLYYINDNRIYKKWKRILKEYGHKIPHNKNEKEEYVMSIID